MSNLNLGKKFPKLPTWEQYCKEIGVEKRTVNIWLERWFGPTIEQIGDGNDNIVLPPEITLLNEDFRTSNIEDNSVDLILTDPPYPEEYLDLWGDLSEFAYKKLKPSGFLVAYSGQYHLIKVMVMLREHLEYYWTMAMLLPGGTQLLNNWNLMCGWKPILIYQKEPFKTRENTFYDTVISPKGEKELHKWQQSEGGVRKLVDIFSKEGDLIIDPFAGSGTFPLVAYQMKRRAIGIEIDRQTYLSAKERIVNDKTKI